MKKLFFLLVFIFGCEMIQARTVMTGNYPFTYAYTTRTLSGLSFQNIPDPMYAVFAYDAKLSLNDIGFEYNAGRGLYVAQYATIPSMKQVDFIQNNGGGAYFTQNNQSMENVTFKRNYSAYGGGIYASKSLAISGQDIIFSANSADKGGAVYANDNLTLAGRNIQFVGNTANVGGGIYALKNVTVRADGGDITFSGNTGYAIYLENANYNLSLQTTNHGRILLYDTLAANGQLQVQIGGDGAVYFYKALSNAHLTLQEGGLYLSPAENWENTTLTVVSGRLLGASGVQHYNLGTVSLGGNLHMVPKVDFQAGLMDTLSISQVSGAGQILVDGFDFIMSPTSEQAVSFEFMKGAGKDRVSVPQKIYSSVHAYEVSYNSLLGTITFMPIPTATIEGFNPQALVQPVWAYTSVKLLADSLRPLRARAHTRYISYEDAPSSFYVTPYVWGGKSSISPLTVNESATGIQAGWDSADLELFESAIVTGGFNVGMARNGLDYQKNGLDTTLYQAGGNLRLYAGNLFGEITAQAGRIKSQLKNIGANQQTITALAQAEIGYNVNIDSQVWFLRPTVGYTYGWMQGGKDVALNEQTLTAPAFSLSQLRSGVTLLTTREDKWHGYVGLSYVKPILGKEMFYAGAEKIPTLEVKPYAEVVAGFQTESAERFAWGAEILGSFGTTRQFGANLTVQF